MKVTVRDVVDATLLYWCGGDQNEYADNKQDDGEWTQEEHDEFIELYGEYIVNMSTRIPEMMLPHIWEAVKDEEHHAAVYMDTELS